MLLRYEYVIGPPLDEISEVLIAFLPTPALTGKCLDEIIRVIHTALLRLPYAEYKRHLKPFFGTKYCQLLKSITLKPKVPTFNSCTKCVRSPGIINYRMPNCYPFSLPWMYR